MIGRVPDVQRWLDEEAVSGCVSARLRLLTTDEGARQSGIFTGYRSSWDIGNTHEGEPTINDAPLLIEGAEELALGTEAIVRLHPLAWEFWQSIHPGQRIEM